MFHMKFNIRFRFFLGRYLRWPNTVFKCLCLIHHYFKTIHALIWRPFFARAKFNHGSIYYRILAKVRAVAMATGLVKDKT